MGESPGKCNTKKLFQEKLFFPSNMDTSCFILNRWRMKAAEPSSHPLEKWCEQQSSLKTEMPENSGMGLLPPFIDVANVGELTVLLGGALS